MGTRAILPIKSFDEAKQRLSDGLDPGPRRALAESMFTDVLTALRRCEALTGIIVVSCDLAAQRIAGGHGAEVLEDRGAGHSAAASLGVGAALAAGTARVLLVAGDCPLLDAAELSALLGARPEDEPFAAIVPDRHGTGTNALLLSPPDAIDPSFGPGSCERHRTLAVRRGIAHAVLRVPTLALDVDTPEDLQALRDELDRRHGGAAHTRGLLSQLSRSMRR
jgi:2-phospho-L-lactate guanylyltransferase